jgi:predicted nucleic acid-binding protein
MGLVLDSGVLIVAEREARPVSRLLATLEREHRETGIVLSAITVIELEHAMHRAQIAAKVDAEARKTGRAIPFADLPIGATALHFGYGAGTRNLRHFQMIPQLNIVRF